MVPIPVLLINGPHPGPLAPSLPRLLLEVLPAARRAMMQAPVLVRERRPGHEAHPDLFALLAKAMHGLVVEVQRVDVGDAADELRAHERFGVVDPVRVGSVAGDARGVGGAEARGGDGVEGGGVVWQPGNGEGADGVVTREVVFPVFQPGEQGRELVVAHLEVFVGVQHAHPVVLVAVFSDASFHRVVLQMRALVLGDGFRGDVGEVEDVFGDVVVVYSWIFGERWVGPVVIYIELSDAVVVVVVGEKFAQLDGNIFHHETWPQLVSACTG